MPLYEATLIDSMKDLVTKGLTKLKSCAKV